ncbi:MAG: FIST C-terminal domain-containing protein [Planctomycetes bacterium]|nr:FIST C-terminal domain-containing protein [Planctomycetota bacterium]
MSLFFSGCQSCVFTKTQKKAAPVILTSVACESEEAFEAGKKAAEKLQLSLKGEMPKAIIVSDTYDDLDLKNDSICGIASIYPKELLFGISTYGSFVQGDVNEYDTVTLCAIAGEGVNVSSSFIKGMGAKGLSLEKHKQKLTSILNGTGEKLANGLAKSNDDKMMIVLADAHSPKNEPLIAGIHKVMGKDFPITGGSNNKNQGENYICYQGQWVSDSALAILLSGDFNVTMSGRKAKTNDAVISTAKDAATQIWAQKQGEAKGVLVFNCAGRKGKLNRLADEYEAIASVTGNTVPMFGVYCAGEFGPADDTAKQESLSNGCGWHAMFTVISQ